MFYSTGQLCPLCGHKFDDDLQPICSRLLKFAELSKEIGKIDRIQRSSREKKDLTFQIKRKMVKNSGYAAIGDLVFGKLCVSARLVFKVVERKKMTNRLILISDFRLE